MPSKEAGGIDRSRATSRLRIWDAVVEREDTCLKANARRYRVEAANAPRAALVALRRHGIGAAEAREVGVHIVLYHRNQGETPLAVFAIAGTPSVPELQIRFARLADGADLRTQGGSLDPNAVEKEIPHAARGIAQARVGSTGLRALRTEAFWQKEIGLYTGTALFLAAFGFPMTPGVFLAGGTVLLLYRAATMGWREFLLIRRVRRDRRDEAMQPELRMMASRNLFLRNHKERFLRGDPRNSVLHGPVAVPDLSGDARLRLYVDEDARISLGALTPGVDDEALEDRLADGSALSSSENVVTVVFRRPRTATLKQDGLQEDGHDTRPDLDEIGLDLPQPAKVDIEDMGSGSHGDAAEPSEIVDAEIIEPGSQLPARRR